MPKYRYIGTGVIAFYVGEKRYEMGVGPRLKTEIEFKRKLTKDELLAINALELVDESKKKTIGE